MEVAANPGGRPGTPGTGEAPGKRTNKTTKHRGQSLSPNSFSSPGRLDHCCRETCWSTYSSLYLPFPNTSCWVSPWDLVSAGRYLGRMFRYVKRMAKRDSMRRLESKGPGGWRVLRAVLAGMPCAERIQDKGPGGRRF